VIRLEVGRQGRRIRRGLNEALGATPRVVTMDGDGQHDPDDLLGSSAAAARAPMRSSSVGVWARSGSARWRCPFLNRVAAIRVAGFFINAGSRRCRVRRNRDFACTRPG
jgi:hypothetical protein